MSFNTSVTKNLLVFNSLAGKRHEYWNVSWTFIWFNCKHFVTESKLKLQKWFWHSFQRHFFVTLDWPALKLQLPANYINELGMEISFIHRRNLKIIAALSRSLKAPENADLR